MAHIPKETGRLGLDAPYPHRLAQAVLEQGKQQRPVDAVEEIGDIELQMKPRRLLPDVQRPHEPLETGDSGMNTLAPAIGVDIVDEDRLVQGLQPGHQPVVDHPVRIGRGMYLLGLGPAGGKANRGAAAIFFHPAPAQ